MITDVQPFTTISLRYSICPLSGVKAVSSCLGTRNELITSVSHRYWQLVRLAMVNVITYFHVIICLWFVRRANAGKNRMLLESL